MKKSSVLAELLALPALLCCSFGETFPSAEDQTMVVACVVNGREGVLKASKDTGRLLNEANYVSEVRGRARRLNLGDGFAEVIIPGQQVTLADNSKVAFFVMERIMGGSLQDLARAGKCWSGQEVALLGEQILRRLQAMHTQERSLGLVHSDIKPGNVLYDSKRNIFVLIDFDCATAIPSIAPKKKGSIKKIQGSYLFTGIDVLNGDYPSPKADLDALGQLLVWCLLGRSQWRASAASQLELAAEKMKWRSSNRAVAKRLHGNLLPEWLHSFIERVDALETAVERPDYDELAKLFSAKNGAFGAASHAAPDLLLSQAPPEKENGPKSPAAKPKTEKKKIKKSVSPTRLPEKKKTAPASPGGPNLRPRRAGTKY